METIQSFFLIGSFIVLALSILNLYFAIQWISGFKLTTGHWDPSILGTRKIWLTNWSDTDWIAESCSSLLISSEIILLRSSASVIGLGGLPVAVRQSGLKDTLLPPARSMDLKLCASSLSGKTSGVLPPVRYLAEE